MDARSKRPSRHPRLDAPALAMLATVTVFTAVALGLTLRLRSELQSQILGREARALHSMIELQEKRAESFYREFGLGTEPEDWFPLLLETSRLRGVVALWLFDQSGALRESLPITAATDLGEADAGRLRGGESFARLHPDADPESLRSGRVQVARTGGVPLLEVLVPLRDPVRGGRGGTAQYWIDGTQVLREMAVLDEHLRLYGGCAAVLVFASVGWAFRRLRRALRELEARTDDLAHANRELGLAAKMSALGAITAHLIHGLRNPLAGLEGYVSNQPADTSQDGGEEWRTALDTTRRLRTLVNEVVSILREEERGGARYRMTFAEVLAAVEARVRPYAESRGLDLRFSPAPEGEMQARVAHLATLVLDNLLRNACEATPRGGRVSIAAAVSAGAATYTVEDGGPGLAPAVRERLFQPVASTKPGGGGIGLVLSSQLAQHAGGTLLLEKSDPTGCRFHLSVPLAQPTP